MSIHDLGDGWLVRWREHGKHPSRTFRRSDGWSKREVEAFHDDKRREVRMARLYPGQMTSAKAEQPFDRFVEEWWRVHKTKLAPSTREQYERIKDQYIVPFFEGTPLCDIGPDQVDDLRAAMVEEGKGAAVQIKVLTVLSAIFRRAVRGKRVLVNPVSLVDKPSGYRQRLVQPFPPERVEALRSRLDNSEQRAFVSLMAYAGAPPQDALALNWADVLDGKLLFRRAKTDKERATRLLAPLADDLSAWRKESGVMVGRVFHWPPSRLRNWRRRTFRPACEDVGIKLSRPYDLRHAFATLMLTEGMKLPELARQMGNLPSTCERWYAHLEHLGEKARDAEGWIYEARNGAAEEAVAL